LAVSKDDQFVAVSLGDRIELYHLEDGMKPMNFHHQVHLYELRGGVPNNRTISTGLMTSNDSIAEIPRGLTSSEAAEEQKRQSTIISRKLYFSTDSKQLVVATQLGDNYVYMDVYDCTRQPISTISENSRSFKLPPWALNDGDLTSVFYDSDRRNAIVTAFLGKEYPVLIPLPGYDSLQKEVYSTKVACAAQSPSGSTFIIANSMTEIIQFEYTTNGTLSPRKLRKSSSKISTSVFKPSSLVLAMPEEDILQCFWVRDGKAMLRTVKVGSTETFTDIDIRPHYERLVSLSRPVIANAPALTIPEMDAT
jgi:hypothetical protein